MELHVGRGTSSGGLTVFPVWNGDGGRRPYTTDLGRVAVGEVEDGATVSGLTARNDGVQPVLILEGQLFEGGWQHRMAVKSEILVADKASLVEVACVEQHRWGGGGHQDARGRRATPFVRSGAAAPPPGRDAQGEVWRRVESYRRVEDHSGTGSLVEHLERDEADVRRLVRRLRPLPGQAGLVVGLAGQPFMLEVFDDSDTLREQFASIVAAAALDALGQPDVPTPGRRARRMVERLERMRLRPIEQAGPGVRLAARDEHLDVSALKWDRRLVHLRATYLRHPSMVGA